MTDAVSFPMGGVVWELNYRGDLHMLRVARSQASARGLRVHDGLSLFCHGWAAALTTALDLREDPGLAQKFMDALEL